MTNKIELDFEKWDDTKDYPLTRPGNNIGYAAILCSIDVGDMSSVRRRQRDVLINEAEKGAVALLAGSLEWLRWRGYSAADVQSKVRAYIQGNKDTQDQQVFRDKQVLKAINEISNPKARKLKAGTYVG